MKILTFKEFLERPRELNESTITIYHGDDHGTKRLNPKLMNHGNVQEGIGIYFQDFASTARDYGKDIVSIEVNTDRLIPQREEVRKHLNPRGLEKMFNVFRKSNPEEFFYFVSDWIEVQEPDDVTSQHVREMVRNIGQEEVRNFQTQMADSYGVELFVKTWLECFPKIDGTYHPNSTEENWYQILNPKIKVTQVRD